MAAVVSHDGPILAVAQKKRAAGPAKVKDPSRVKVFVHHAADIVFLEDAGIADLHSLPHIQILAGLFLRVSPSAVKLTGGLNCGIESKFFTYGQSV
jgi:hypothetical protein